MYWPLVQICLSYIIAFRFHLKQNIIFKSNNKGLNDPSSPKDLTMLTHAEGVTDLLWERKYMQRCDGVCDARTISIRQCNIFGLLHVPWSMADIRCMADIRRAEDGYSEQDGVLGIWEGTMEEIWKCNGIGKWEWDRERNLGRDWDKRKLEIEFWKGNGSGRRLRTWAFPICSYFHSFLTGVWKILPVSKIKNIFWTLSANMIIDS